MLDTLPDICAMASKVDVVIYSTCVWPISFLETIPKISCLGHLDIKLKDPSWKTQLAHFPREYIYQQLANYDLFVYTEDDLHIRPKHLDAYLRETRYLENSLPEQEFPNYSIGFLRYEEEQHKQQNDSPSKIIWEHYWELSSLLAFARRHMALSLPTSRGEKKYYFNGAGTFHQGMFMATPRQLVAWRDRPPNCRFNTTWFLDSREKISSLHLFDTFGCNVTQIIPVASYDNFLIHHMPNAQHHVLFKYLPRSMKINNIETTELGKWLEESTRLLSNNTVVPSWNYLKNKINMTNDETEKNGEPPDLSDFMNYTSS